MDNRSMACSTSEATLLATLLGANRLLGLSDPFRGWLTEEIQETWATATDTLSSRKYLRVERNGTVTVDTYIAGLLATWAYAEASFIATHTKVGRPTEVCHFHLSHGAAVEQEIGVDSSVYLSPLSSAQAVYERIISNFGLAYQKAPLGSFAALPERYLSQARDHAAASDLNTAKQLLKRAGLSESTSLSLADTLTHPSSNDALVCVAPRSATWEIAGLGLLAGENGLWLLRSSTKYGESWVEISPCSGEQARIEVRRAMNRLLPVPLPVLTLSGYAREGI